MQAPGINAFLYWDRNGDRDADRRERDRTDRGGYQPFMRLSAVLQVGERTKKYPRRTARVNVFLCSFH